MIVDCLFWADSVDASVCYPFGRFWIVTVQCDFWQSAATFNIKSSVKILENLVVSVEGTRRVDRGQKRWTDFRGIFSSGDTVVLYTSPSERSLKASGKFALQTPSFRLRSTGFNGFTRIFTDLWLDVYRASDVGCVQRCNKTFNGVFILENLF